MSSKWGFVSLTGVPFLVSTVAMAVFMFAVVVWMSPRWQGSPWMALPRGFAAVVFAASTVLALVVGANRDNLWFTSWADLSGSTEVAATDTKGADALKAAGGGATTASATSSPTQTPRPPLPAPGQRLQWYTFTGPESGLTGKIAVYLPAGFDQNAPAGTYPVIAAMHGIPGAIEGWTDKLRLPHYVDAAVAENKIKAPIVVVPQLQFPAGKDNECIDLPGQEKVETWLSTDLHTFAVQRFGVIAERSGWATLGYSAGGWCSAMLGMKHPEIYGAAASLDGYFSPHFDGQDNTPFKGTDNDLVHVATTKKPSVAMYVQGAMEGVYWPETKAFVEAVQAPTSVKSVLLKTGGHRWGTWERQVPDVLAWMGQSVPGLVP